MFQAPIRGGPHFDGSDDEKRVDSTSKPSTTKPAGRGERNADKQEEKKQEEVKQVDLDLTNSDPTSSLGQSRRKMHSWEEWKTMTLPELPQEMTPHESAKRSRTQTLTAQERKNIIQQAPLDHQYLMFSKHKSLKCRKKPSYRLHDNVIEAFRFFFFGFSFLGFLGFLSDLVLFINNFKKFCRHDIETLDKMGQGWKMFPSTNEKERKNVVSALQKITDAKEYAMNNKRLAEQVWQENHDE